MPLFTSARERRLWAWTLAVVVAIYSTLGLARTLTGLLRDQGLISDAFWLGLFLIGTAVILQGLKARPGGAEIGVALGVALDECIQLLLPSRVFDLIDILFNILASVMAVAASLALSWARRYSKASSTN